MVTFAELKRKAKNSTTTNKFTALKLGAKAEIRAEKNILKTMRLRAKLETENEVGLTAVQKFVNYERQERLKNRKISGRDNGRDNNGLEDDVETDGEELTAAAIAEEYTTVISVDGRSKSKSPARLYIEEIGLKRLDLKLETQMGIAKKFGKSPQRISQIVKDVRRANKKKEQILAKIRKEMDE